MGSPSVFRGWRRKHLARAIRLQLTDQTGLLQVRLSLFEDRYDIFIEPRVGQWSGFGEILPLG